MKIVFSFDDGRSDAFDAFKILKKFNFFASFHITTGFIDGSFRNENNVFGVNRTPLTINDMKIMYSYGMDISSHGNQHLMANNDFRISKQKLEEWNLSTGKIGFSIPNSEYTKQELESFISKEKQNLLYIRAGRNNKCYSLLGKIMFVLYRAFHFQFAFNYFNKHNINYCFDPFLIYSVVILKDTKIKNIIKFIKKHSNDDCVVVFMFHSIVSNPINKWEYSIDKFESLCRRLSEENIDVQSLKSLII